MRKHVLIFLVLVPILSTLPAYAQPEEGDNEFQIFGSLSIGGGSDSGVVGITWGRFYTPRQEAGLRASTAVFGNFDLSGTIGPFWRYNFVTKGKAVPYFTLSVVGSFGNSVDIPALDETDPGLQDPEFEGSSSRSGDILATFEVGSRWFMTRQTAFSIAGQTSYDVEASDLQDSFTVLFGFTYLWHK